MGRRAVLAALPRRLSTARRRQLSLIITPRTLLRWHAELILSCSKIGFGA